VQGEGGGVTYEGKRRGLLRGGDLCREDISGL